MQFSDDEGEALLRVDEEFAALAEEAGAEETNLPEPLRAGMPGDHLQPRRDRFKEQLAQIRELHEKFTLNKAVFLTMELPIFDNDPDYDPSRAGSVSPDPCDENGMPLLSVYRDTVPEVIAEISAGKDAHGWPLFMTDSQLLGGFFAC